MLRFLKNLGIFRNIDSRFFGLALCFTSHFLAPIFSSMPQTIQFSNFPLEKCNILLKALKQQFSNMADAGNSETPERSSPAPTTRRKFLAKVIQNPLIFQVNIKDT